MKPRMYTFLIITVLLTVGTSIYLQSHRESKALESSEGQAAMLRKNVAASHSTVQIDKTRNAPAEIDNAAINTAVDEQASSTAASSEMTENSRLDVLPIQDPTVGDAETLTPLNSLDEQFMREGYDGEWAPELEARMLEEFYTLHYEKSELESIECRSTLCRIRVSHSDPQAEREFYQHLIANLDGRQGLGHRSLDEYGNPITLLYRFR